MNGLSPPTEPGPHPLVRGLAGLALGLLTGLLAARLIPRQGPWP